MKSFNPSFYIFYHSISGNYNINLNYYEYIFMNTVEPDQLQSAKLHILLYYTRDRFIDKIPMLNCMLLSNCTSDLIQSCVI